MKLGGTILSIRRDMRCPRLSKRGTHKRFRTSSGLQAVLITSVVKNTCRNGRELHGKPGSVVLDPGRGGGVCLGSAVSGIPKRGRNQIGYPTPRRLGVPTLRNRWPEGLGQVAPSWAPAGPSVGGGWVVQLSRASRVGTGGLGGGGTQNDAVA